jgi:HSP20 family protein
VDLTEGPADYIVDIDLPGTKQADVDVEFQDGVLIVSGKRQRQEALEMHLLKSERFEGTFRRSVAIPGEIDEDRIEATFASGVLSVTLPKHASKSPTKIQIKSAGE